MSHFFNALVIAGAAISASACGGKATRTEGDGGDGGSNGEGGSGLSGRPGSGATGGMPADAGANSGGTGGAGASSGGTGGAGANSGGTGGTLGGTGGYGALPEPGATAQWNCENAFTDCVNVLGTAAARLLVECPLESNRPKSAGDCAARELFTCYLAVTPVGETVLVNCECQPNDTLACTTCMPIGQSTYGAPVVCSEALKTCACAYTGILVR